MAVSPPGSPEQVITKIARLYTGEFPKHSVIFHQEMQGIYDFIKQNCNGRCISKKILNFNERESLITKLYKRYMDGEHDLYDLNEENYLRHLRMHDKRNSKNYELIGSIIKKLVVTLPNGDKLVENHDFMYAMRHLGATIFDPNEISKPAYKLSLLPEEKRKAFITTMNRLESELVEASANKWLDLSKLQGILKGVQANQALPIAPHATAKLSPGVIVPYFIHNYLELINSGGEDSETFRQTIIESLKKFMGSPEISGVKTFQGSDIEYVVKQLSDLCLVVYKEFPFSYEGTDKEQMDYIVETYAEKPEGVAFLLHKDGKTVGGAMGITLSKAPEHHLVPFKGNTEINLERVFYIGEECVYAQFRRKGHAKEIFAAVEKYAKESKRYDVIMFASIQMTEELLAKKPEEYFDPEPAAKRHGFVKTELAYQGMWRSIGDKEETPKKMVYWFKTLT